jgi:hypothetical protein
MMGLPDDPLANLRLPAAALTPDPVFEDLAKANLLPGRLQLYTKGTAVSRGLIGRGEFGIPESDERITGLGKSVDILLHPTCENRDLVAAMAPPFAPGRSSAEHSESRLVSLRPLAPGE